MFNHFPGGLKFFAICGQICQNSAVGGERMLASTALSTIKLWVNPLSLTDLLQVIVLLGGGAMSVHLFVLGVRLLQCDRSQYERNKKLSKSIRNVLRGGIKSGSNSDHGHLVRAGLAKKLGSPGELIEQGELAEEALAPILRHR